MLALLAGRAGAQATFAQSCAKRLSSPALHGRGYVAHGVNDAATLVKYIADSLGSSVQAYQSVFQPVAYDVNTIRKCTLTIGGAHLRPGNDYL